MKSVYSKETVRDCVGQFIKSNRKFKERSDLDAIIDCITRKVLAMGTKIFDNGYSFEDIAAVINRVVEKGRKLKKSYLTYTADQLFMECVARAQFPMSFKVYLWFRRRDLLNDIVAQLNSAYDAGDTEVDRFTEDYEKIDEIEVVNDCIEWYYDMFFQHDPVWADTHVLGKLEVEYEHSVAHEEDENEKAKKLEEHLNQSFSVHESSGDVYRVRGTKARPVPSTDEELKKVVVEIRETRVKKIMFSVPEHVDTSKPQLLSDIADAVGIAYTANAVSMRGAKRVLTQFIVDGLGEKEFAYLKNIKIEPDYEGKIPECWFSYNNDRLNNPKEIKE